MCLINVLRFSICQKPENRVNSYIEQQWRSCSYLLNRQKKKREKIWCCPLKPPLSVMQSTVTSLCQSTRSRKSAMKILQLSGSLYKPKVPKKRKVLFSAFITAYWFMYPLLLALYLFFLLEMKAEFLWARNRRILFPSHLFLYEHTWETAKKIPQSVCLQICLTHLGKRDEWK